MMNDNDIIKALNHCCGNDKHDDKCTEEKCYQVVLPEMRDGDLRWCRQWLIKDALDLIKRQQAEIERLKEENKHHIKTVAENERRALDVTLEEIEKARAEAIKEFAKEFRSHYDDYEDYENIYAHHIRDDIDFLVEEMIEKGGEG